MASLFSRHFVKFGLIVLCLCSKNLYAEQDAFNQNLALSPSLNLSATLLNKEPINKFSSARKDFMLHAQIDYNPMTKLTAYAGHNLEGAGNVVGFKFTWSLKR